jgi:hypothetical protein
MANPTKFSWTDPTVNTDGTAITAGEITGFQIGVRPSTGTAGTYPTLIPVSGATTTSAPVPTLAAGTYAAAIMTIGPNDSAWSTEQTFTITEVPTPPSGFSIA